MLGRFIDHPSLITQRWRPGIDAALYASLDNSWFRGLGVRTVLDIGAHEGRFGATLKCLLPEARVDSFEPQAACVAVLEGYRRHHRDWHVHQIALADRSGSMEFHANDYSMSSSLRPMTDAHRRAFPMTERASASRVEVCRLDDVPNLAIVEPLAVKIDVQGAEDMVFAGGRKTLARASLLIIETSFVELYAGQPLFADIFADLGAMGFVYGGALSTIVDPATGQNLQEDSIFLRQGLRP